MAGSILSACLQRLSDPQRRPRRLRPLSLTAPPLAAVLYLYFGSIGLWLRQALTLVQLSIEKFYCRFTGQLFLGGDRARLRDTHRPLKITCLSEIYSIWYMALTGLHIAVITYQRRGAQQQTQLEVGKQAASSHIRGKRRRKGIRASRRVADCPSGSRLPPSAAPTF